MLIPEGEARTGLRSTFSASQLSTPLQAGSSPSIGSHQTFLALH